MASDQNGKPVQFGDYLVVEVTGVPDRHNGFSGIVRVVKLSETSRGVAAVGAFVDLVGNGRVAKVPVDLAKAKLVLKADGSAV